MKKPIVLLDCDGPLANFTKAYLDVVYALTGKRHHPDEVDRWNIHECTFFRELDNIFRMKMGGWELKEAIEKSVMGPGFCERIEVAEDAKEEVSKLASFCDVYVVTSPWDSSPTWMYERTKWVVEHFPEIGERRVIHAAQKHLVFGNVFVDDKPSHVENWKWQWKNEFRRNWAKPVLFDMSHNRSKFSFERGGWDDVLRFAKEVQDRM